MTINERIRAAAVYGIVSPNGIIWAYGVHADSKSMRPMTRKQVEAILPHYQAKTNIKLKVALL